MKLFLYTVFFKMFLFAMLWLHANLQKKKKKKMVLMDSYFPFLFKNPDRVLECHYNAKLFRFLNLLIFFDLIYYFVSKLNAFCFLSIMFSSWTLNNRKLSFGEIPWPKFFELYCVNLYQPSVVKIVVII